jgi:tetratricopeptide (TPR) repeat protein
MKLTAATRRRGGLERTRSRIRPWCASAVLLFGACGGGWPAYRQSQYDHDIEESTRAIAAAQDDNQRAQGHAARGRAYSEKARYSRSFKLISSEEYGRLFDLAIKDHDQAVALSPGDTQLYFSRGRTHYDRAALEDGADPRTKARFDLAKADFSRAIEKDGRNAQAFDMRGLVHTQAGESDQAISDFTQEMKIDPRLGALRLAEAHCQRGSALQRANKYDPAIGDYERAMEFGPPADGCECQPESPLAWLYLETGQYDKSWGIVHKAQSSGRWIAPDVLEQLKKASGRDR